MSIEREDCCDDLAVAGCGRLVFASALLQMAESCANNRDLVIGSQLEAMAADGGNRSHLTRRIHRLLEDADTPHLSLGRMSIRIAAFVMLMLAASVVAVAQTGASQADDSVESNKEELTYDAAKFAMPSKQYTHLVYEQSIPDPAVGLKPRRVIQPLPGKGESVRPATPFSQSELKAASVHRIRNTYPTYRPGESVEVRGNTIVLRNADKGTEKVLIRGTSDATGFTRILARVAVSPDRKRIAAALLSVRNDVALTHRPVFDLFVVDVSGDASQSWVIRNVIRDGVHGNSIMGGALQPDAVAPPIFWSDNDNLLVVTPKPGFIGWRDLGPGSDVNAFGDSGSVIYVRNDEVLTPTHDLLQFDIETNATRNVCDLKIKNYLFGGGQTSTDFWRRSDGAVILRSHGTDTRIDLSESAAIPDRRLSPHYELRGDRYRPSLWHGDIRLAEMIGVHNVGVSPDGRSIAWYAPSENPHVLKNVGKMNVGNTSQFPTTLWFHSQATGTMKLAEGNFAWENYYEVFDNPVLRSPFRWLSQDDFSSGR